MLRFSASPVPLLVSLAALVFPVGGGDPPGEAAPAGAIPGIAVVELFTSEGCSSCPPADELLSRLVASAAKDGRRVYPIAFHVDYWNSLGHPDPFSAKAYSERQRAYAAAMRSKQVYTPQMIVNGINEF